MILDFCKKKKQLNITINIFSNRKTLKRTMYTARQQATRASMNALNHHTNQVGTNGHCTVTHNSINPHLSAQSQSMSVICTRRLKDGAAKDLANDANGKHTHVCKESCINAGCIKKVCPVLCNSFDNMKILGHTTHGPIPGRFCRFLGEQDATGAHKAQYFVKINKEKVVTSTEMQKYTSKEIKDDPVQSAYVKLPHISEKLKDDE